jgi:hypothetical protein
MAVEPLCKFAISKKKRFKMGRIISVVPRSRSVLKTKRRRKFMKTEKYQELPRHKSPMIHALVQTSGRAVGILAVLIVQSGQAQVFPPQGDDVTPSMGVFRIIVDPLFRPLLGPTGPPTSFAGYTGFHSSDGRLTSPMLIDSSTIIGRSNPNPRPTPFPQPLGAGSWDVLLGYSDYPAIPFLWFAAPVNTDEVLTEIKTFVLETVSASTGQICSNTMVPMAPPNYPMVKAGTFAGVSPRSLGIVQENGPPGPPDFPARSFFDIFVDVNLPPLPGTESSVAFPATGAVLTNVQPLIVTNLSLSSFPPQVIYIHGGNTNGVQIRFKFDNPPYWAAGDLFGTLSLAGHGTYTNDCSQEAALTAAVLGTPTHPMPDMPTEWLRPTTLAPSPASAYESLLTDTNPPAGSDTLMFTIPGAGTIFGRNFRESGFPNSITPPPPASSALYSASNVLATFQISIDQQTWFLTQVTGPLTVMMDNTTVPGEPVDKFDIEIVQMALSGVSEFGPIMLRESPTKQSLGKHTIRSDPRGYRVSSFFDVFTELSTDGGATWIPADRSIRMQVNAPPPAPGSLFITRATGGGASLQWLGPFTLQSSLVVTGGYKDVSGSTGGSLVNIWHVSPGPNQQYFRLRQ